MLTKKQKKEFRKRNRKHVKYDTCVFCKRNYPLKHYCKCHNKIIENAYTNIFMKVPWKNSQEYKDFARNYFASKEKEFIKKKFTVINTKEKEKTIRKKLRRDFYSSKSWRMLRYKYLSGLKHRRCMCCGATPSQEELHVDHIKPKSKRPDLALDINNLQLLCKQCNLGKSNLDDTDFRGV